MGFEIVSKLRYGVAGRHASVDVIIFTLGLALQESISRSGKQVVNACHAHQHLGPGQVQDNMSIIASSSTRLSLVSLWSTATAICDGIVPCRIMVTYHGLISAI